MVAFYRFVRILLILLLFQPIISLRGDADEHYEVFLRMPDPQRSGTRLMAAELVPAAERAGLATALDRLSLLVAGRGNGGEEACFRCGIYFRDRCLLRGAPGNRTCYQHLGLRPERAAATT